MKDDSDANIVLAEAKKGTDLLRLIKSEFKGTRHLDLRLYYYDTKSMDWAPTKKGVTVNPAKKEDRELIAILAKEVLKISEGANPKKVNN